MVPLMQNEADAERKFHFCKKINFRVSRFNVVNYENKNEYVMTGMEHM
jgi:hypothetical protein